MSWYFYPRPPRGGRPTPRSPAATVTRFLSTPSARRATVLHVLDALPVSDFYPRPPRGGRPNASLYWATTADISIHALREEGDENPTENVMQQGLFLSTPSARRATPPGQVQQIRHVDFYPRPPRGGRPPRARDTSSSLTISIHALREEGDLNRLAQRQTSKISIHALREEGDG